MSLSYDWQTSKQKLSERSQHLLETGQWSDCNFIVGQEPQQQTFKSHKLFLAMFSPVFEAMFFEGMAEKNDPIPIRDVQPEAFKALLEYIYMDKVELDSFELACELCYCAKKYMLPSLVEKCTKFMMCNLPQNSCRVYQFSELFKLFEEPVLEEKSLQIMRTKMDEVLKPEGFFTQRFSRAKSIKTYSMSMGLLPGNGECSSSNKERCANWRSVHWYRLWWKPRKPWEYYAAPKYCCTRYMIQATGTNYWNSDMSRHYVKFSVNQPICVLGIQIPMQSPSDLRADTIYEEHICVRLLDVDRNDLPLGYTCLTAEVKFHTLVEVIFNQPVYIKRHKVYKIEVTFTKAGYYPILAAARDYEHCDPVMFTFDRDNTSFYSLDGCIRSIIFTYD